MQVSQSTSSTAFKLAPFACILGGLALAFCQWMIFVYAPIESTMRLPQKIFYLHLPLAIWGMLSFFGVFAASILYLCSKKPHWDALAGALAEVGLLMATLTVISGCLWARPSWGIWWTWDARLTTALVMCFIYAGYLIIRGMDMPPARKAKVTAVVGIVAFLDVPLVYVSARLWSYIHPPSIGLEPDMKLTVIVCILSFGLLWAGLTAFRFRLAQDERRLEQISLQRLMNQG